MLIPGYTKQDFVNIDIPFSPYHAAKFNVLHSSEIVIQFICIAAIRHMHNFNCTDPGEIIDFEALNSYTI